AIRWGRALRRARPQQRVADRREVVERGVGQALAVEVGRERAAGEAHVGRLGGAAVGVAVADVHDLASIAPLVDDRALALLAAHRARLSVPELDDAALG